MSRYHYYLVAVAFLGWMFMWFEFHLVSVMAPLILPALHITPLAFGSIISISFAAAFVFTFVFGPVVDTAGRRGMFQITMLGTTLFSALQYFITGFANWAVLRSLTQMFTFSEQAVEATLITESVPARYRGGSIGIVQAGFPAGLAVAGLVGAFVVPAIGWRAAFLLSALPALIVLLIRAYVKEPERFEHLKRVRAAMRAGEQATVTRLVEERPVDAQRATKGGYQQLFAPDLRRTSIALGIWSLINAGVGIGVLTFLPTFLTIGKHIPNQTTSLIVTVVGFWAVVGYLSAGFLGDRYGRKEVSIVYAALGTVGLAWALVAANVAWLVVGLLIWGFGNNGMFSCLTALLAESFPTRVRGTGSSFVEGCFGIGAALFPLLFGASAQALGFTSTYWIYGVVPYALVIVFFAFAMRRLAPRVEVEQISV